MRVAFSRMTKELSESSRMQLMTAVHSSIMMSECAKATAVFRRASLQKSARSPK